MQATKVVYKHNWYWIDSESLGHMNPAYTDKDLMFLALVDGKPLVFYDIKEDSSITLVKLPKNAKK